MVLMMVSNSLFSFLPAIFSSYFEVTENKTIFKQGSYFEVTTQTISIEKSFCPAENSLAGTFLTKTFSLSL